jgi:hypothetical protein
MNLTEGQLFTIEALNRIDGFVWPDGAKFAAMDNCVSCVDFYVSKVILHDRSLHFTGKRSHLKPVHIGYVHPDWRNSLITREQFDNVDGWVNINGNVASSMDALIDVMLDGGLIVSGVTYSDALLRHQPFSNWRYHKPTKESEMKDTETFQPTIHETYYRYKKQRENTADARKALEASMEAEDKLLEQIKAWNLEYGFDIRVLDESDEVPVVEPDQEPELVITDWRDLRIGDIVEVIKVSKMSEIRRYKEIIGRHLPVVHTEPPGVEGQPVQVDCDGKLIFISRWKFIRRPSK